MSTNGQNLAGFLDAQIAFSAHIRNPEVNPKPADVEQRRMDIYTGLFYRNIKSFLDSAFPVFKSCLETTAWEGLVREFVHTHSSQSPYFLEISQEFLNFLSGRGLHGLPEFSLELAHYEWVELALDVAPGEAPENSSQWQGGDLVLSPLAIPLAYNYAVQNIGPDHQAEGPVATFLIAYRDGDDEVHFMASNALTHRLLELCQDGGSAQAVPRLTEELRQQGHDLSLDDVTRQAADIFAKLYEASVLVDTN